MNINEWIKIILGFLFVIGSPISYKFLKIDGVICLIFFIVGLMFLTKGSI